MERPETIKLNIIETDSDQVQINETVILDFFDKEGLVNKIVGCQRIGFKTFAVTFIDKQNRDAILGVSNRKIFDYNGLTFKLETMDPLGKLLNIYNVPYEVDDQEILDSMQPYLIAPYIKRGYIAKYPQVTNCTRHIRYKDILLIPPRELEIRDGIKMTIRKPGEPIRDPKCRKCLETGHLTKECPNSTTCIICKLTGHISKDCPQNKKNVQKQIPKSYADIAKERTKHSSEFSTSIEADEPKETEKDELFQFYEDREKAIWDGGEVPRDLEEWRKMKNGRAVPLCSTPLNQAAKERPEKPLCPSPSQPEGRPMGGIQVTQEKDNQKQAEALNKIPTQPQSKKETNDKTPLDIPPPVPPRKNTQEKTVESEKITTETNISDEIIQGRLEIVLDEDERVSSSEDAETPPKSESRKTRRKKKKANKKSLEKQTNKEVQEEDTTIQSEGPTAGIQMESGEPNENKENTECIQMESSEPNENKENTEVKIDEKENQKEQTNTKPAENNNTSENHTRRSRSIGRLQKDEDSVRARSQSIKRKSDDIVQELRDITKKPNTNKT